MNAGLYLHVPFCSAVCPYCDFAVHIGTAQARRRFVHSLVTEIERVEDWVAPIDTVYLGGGTPSMLDAEDLERILAAARNRLPLVEGTRLHLEVNPEDVDEARVSAWRDLGVHFLSLGIQSFDDGELRFLGRRHDGAQAVAAAETALAGDFATVSLDLMFGLPDADERTLDANLDTLLALGPQHASLYQLTVHEGTTFGRWRDRGRLVELDDARQGEHYRRVQGRLADAGLTPYEVSNFSRGDAHRSAHNQKYWAHVPYLGLGPSAHAFDGRCRWWNLRDTRAWSESLDNGRSPVAESESLDREDLALERVMLGLRRTDGIDLAAYRVDFGADLVAGNEAAVEQLESEQLVRLDAGRLSPTHAGLAVADWLATRIEPVVRTDLANVE